MRVSKEKYKNARWLNVRKTVLIRDSYKCLACKRKGISALADTVHHCNPDNELLFYAMDNLISLCHACHNAMHDRAKDELTDLGKEWLRRSNAGKIGKNKFFNPPSFGRKGF